MKRVEIDQSAKEHFSQLRITPFCIMSFSCFHGSVGGPCTYLHNSTGVQLGYNATCNICCQDGYGLLMDFKKRGECDPVSHQEIAAKIGLFISAYMIAIFVSIFMLISNLLSVSSSMSAIPVILITNILVSILAIVDNAMMYAIGRHSEDSGDWFWFLYFFLQALLFMVHHQMMYFELSVNETTFHQGESERGGKSKRNLSGYLRVANDPTGKLQKPRATCAISIGLWCLLLFAALQAIVGLIVYKHVDSFGSYHTFGYVFAMTFVNQVITVLQMKRKCGCSLGGVCHTFEIALSIVFFVITLTIGNMFVAEVFYSCHVLWTVLVVIPYIVVQSSHRG